MWLRAPPEVARTITGWASTWRESAGVDDVRACRTTARSGRKTRARAFDALIAAVALAHDLPIYTANPDDFAGIDGLEVVAVDVKPG